MIKVIAFDLVGVLVSERDNVLTAEEEKLERMFGANKSDEDYLLKTKKILKNEELIPETTLQIMRKLYQVKNEQLFQEIKREYPEIKIIIATNHVSFVKEYIREVFPSKDLDQVIISAEIHKVKPDPDFYQYLLDQYQLKSNELLFIDDRIDNVNGARKLGISSFVARADIDLSKEILTFLKS